MLVRIENMRHWVDDTFQVVVHTNDAQSFTEWLDLSCPHHVKLQVHSTHVPGLSLGWKIVTFTLVESQDVMMLKLAWK